MQAQNAIQVSCTNTEDILTEIENAFYDIPFGNTRFQNEMFVIAANVTPARMYRSIGLELHTRLQALRSVQFQVKKSRVRIEQLKQEIANPEVNLYEKQLKQIELEETTSGMLWDEKTTNDALVELNLFYDKFKKFPRYTREQFEAEERLYFEQKLQRQVLGLNGAKESLLNMIDDKETLKAFLGNVELKGLAGTSGEITSLIDESMRSLIRIASSTEEGQE